MTAMDFRQYDNVLGRFHGVDALAELDYSGSTYSFGFNSPVYFSDPSGLTAESSDTDPPINGGKLKTVVVKNNYKKKVTSTNNNPNDGINLYSLFLSSFPNGIAPIFSDDGGGGGILGMTTVGANSSDIDHPIPISPLNHLTYFTRHLELR